MCAVIQLHSQVGLHRTAQVSTPVVWWDSLLGTQGRRRRFHRWSNLELFLFGGQAYNLWIECLVPQILRRCVCNSSLSEQFLLKSFVILLRRWDSRGHWQGFYWHHVCVCVGKGLHFQVPFLAYLEANGFKILVPARSTRHQPNPLSRYWFALVKGGSSEVFLLQFRVLQNAYSSNMLGVRGFHWHHFCVCIG
jgi:hypothetical protein